MNIYRSHRLLPVLAPKTPWWRLVKALIFGTLRRWKSRQPVWITTDAGAGWCRRKVK